MRTVFQRIFSKRNLFRLRERESELKSEIRIQEFINNKLTVQNTELIESLKVYKLTTNMKQTQSTLTIVGNTVFILIQLVNAL